MKREELVRSKEYWVTQLQISLFDAVDDYINSKGLTRTQFAQQLGVSKGYVSQILNGDFDHKLSKFVELMVSCNKAPVIKVVDLDELVSDEMCGITTHSYRDFGLKLPVNKDKGQQPGGYLQKSRNYSIVYKSQPTRIKDIKREVSAK